MSNAHKSIVRTFKFEDEHERFGRRVAVDDTDFDLVVDTNVNGFLSSAAGAAATAHCRASLARHLPDRRVDAAHPAPSWSRRRRRRREAFSVVLVDARQNQTSRRQTVDAVRSADGSSSTRLVRVRKKHTRNSKVRRHCISIGGIYCVSKTCDHVFDDKLS